MPIASCFSSNLCIFTLENYQIQGTDLAVNLGLRIGSGRLSLLALHAVLRTLAIKAFVDVSLLPVPHSANLLRTFNPLLGLELHLQHPHWIQPFSESIIPLPALWIQKTLLGKQDAKVAKGVTRPTPPLASWLHSRSFSLPTITMFQFPFLLPSLPSIHVPNSPNLKRWSSVTCGLKQLLSP